MDKFTKYEAARIIGARALQLAMDAPLLIKIDQNELKEINFDSLKIAEIEFNANVLPITVSRPLPRKIEGNLITKPKKEEISAEKEKILEKRGMKEIAGSEIMELATPEDEIEEEKSREQVIEEEGV